MKRTQPLLSVLCAGAMSFAIAAANAADQAQTNPGGVTSRDADNTGRNVRDRSGKTATPTKQANNKHDLEITRQLRQAITKDDSLSMNAHNVKIVTQNGVVTLRGPVKDASEKADIVEKAHKIQGVKRVDNQLEVAS